MCNSKRCSHCHKSKPVDLFGNDKSKSDGKCCYCLDCRNTIRRERYDSDHEKQFVIPYDQKSTEQKARNIEANRKWRLKNKGKRLAHKAVELALKAGKLFKSPHCMTCGVTCKTEAHHWKGYEPAHYLDVIWLCRKCHGAHDRLIRHNQIWPYDTLAIVEFPVVSHPIDFNKHLTRSK